MSAWWTHVTETFVRCFITDDRYKLLLSGIGVTIKVSLLAALLGVIIGFLIALCSLSKKKPLNLIGKVYTDIIRGTPSVTQLMIIYFVIFATVHWPKWVIAAIAFGINSGAYVSEIIRAGIMSIDRGQTEAGRSLGNNGNGTNGNAQNNNGVSNGPFQHQGRDVRRKGHKSQIPDVASENEMINEVIQNPVNDEIESAHESVTARWTSRPTSRLSTDWSSGIRS